MWILKIFFSLFAQANNNIKASTTDDVMVQYVVEYQRWIKLVKFGGILLK